MKDVQRQFGKTAAAYVASPTHAASKDLDRLVALARDHGGERVVDVGTGVGHTLRRVAPHFGAAIGLDATREMLAAGRGVLAEAHVANALLVQADARAMPLPDAAFDEIKQQVPFDRYVELDKQMQKDDKFIPDELSRIAADCGSRGSASSGSSSSSS